MFKNSTNINQINNHFLPQTIEPWHMVLEIQVLAWDRHTKVAGLNQYMYFDSKNKQLNFNVKTCWLLFLLFIGVNCKNEN